MHGVEEQPGVAASALSGPRAAVPPQPRDPDACWLASWDRSGQARRWPLEGSSVTVGRSLTADVVLSDDPLVSRVHVCLERVAGVWTVVDDGLSRNGTYVNGARVSGRIPLRDRDSLRIGGTVLTFCAPAQADEPRTLVGSALPGAAHLTPAQRAVLVALCRPYADGAPYALPASNAAIAAELYLSVDAVKEHLRTLFGKLGVDALPQNQKRVRLAELALQSGVVSRRELAPDPR